MVTSAVPASTGGPPLFGIVSPITIVDVEAETLSVPLQEPFVIASGQLDVTRAVLVRVTVQDDRGRRSSGLGEAAALPPVTSEDQPELLATISRVAASLRGARLATAEEVRLTVLGVLPDSAIARAGVETAVVDAWARLLGVPLYAFLRGSPAPLPRAMLTDITLPISRPEHMSQLARRHHAAGFDCFKVKVGRDWKEDRASLRAVAAAVPGARFRLDANAGFGAADALALLEGTVRDGLTVECFEQPCGIDDLHGLAEVTARSPVPVVADESFRGAGDLSRLLASRAVSAVNLKLVKLGGPVTTLELARRARAAGLRLMAGAMVETRVGLLAMAHVVAALGGVDWVDLDTAFLLADDPFEGGWAVSGARIELTAQPGMDVRRRA